MNPDTLKKIKNFSLLGLSLLLLTAFMVWQGWFSGIQNRLQNKIYDQDSASSEIIIAAIDETSLRADRLGPLTQWKRSDYAKVIEQLNQAGAAVVGIDITFPDSSSHGEKDDGFFQAALEKYPNTVLATRYYFEGKTQKSEWPNKNLDPKNDQLGTINVQLDEDGFVRKLPLFTQSEKGVIEAFALSVARKYLNAPPENYAIQNDLFHFSSDRNIPALTQRDGDQVLYSMYINYFAQPYSFQQISFADLLEGNAVDDKKIPIDFKDKIVLIGPTAIDLQDDYLSPVSEGVRMPGVEIHANALQTIIEGKFLRDQSPLAFWLTLILLTLINVGLFSFLKLRYALPMVLVEVFGFLVAGILAYEWQVIMNMVYPSLLALMSFVGAYLLRFIVEQKKRKFIEDALGRYVNKSIVKQIQQHPETLVLGGIKREITVFFSDIRGFTSISEGMSPTELVAFLNEYLSEMTEIILKRDGTLDKYEGDAIMAFWNAPIAQHEPALNACLAALENQERLAELRKKWKKEGKPEMHIGIGLNTGDAVVGNMGSIKRFNYTAMGDNVNLGSRLEGINKFYGSEILMTEATYKEVTEHVVVREVDLIRVKGRKEPVRIFELQARKGQLSEEQTAANARFAEALNLYRADQFPEAKKIFEELTEDPVSKVFAERCGEFMKKGPEKAWGGVWTFESK